MPKKKIHSVTAYANAVLAGEIVAGRLVTLACRRHLRDLELAGDRGLRFDPKAADHAINFFPEFLRHNEGIYADEPFELSDNQKFIVGSLFGWIKADGFRRYRHAYIESGKGSGKSPLAAGIALYGLIMDDERGSEIYCAAVTRDQAAIAFRDCKHMAEKSLFANRLEIGENNIAYRAMNSFIRPVSSEAKSLDGKRVFMSILDEVHEHRSSLVIDKMVAGNKGRTQPLNLEISNSGFDRTSICWEHHEYSRQVLEQVYDDDTWFAYVCGLDICSTCLSEGKSSPQDECPNCDHWWDENVWLKANPNLGLTPTVEYLRGEVEKARRIPSKALLVKRLNCCIWTESSMHWLPMDDWDACKVDGDLAEQLKGRLCYGGLDLADSNDTASLALVFPPTPDAPRYYVLCWIWVPEQMRKRTTEDKQRFQTWISNSHMIATPGNLIDYSYILLTIGQIRLDYNLSMLAFDRYGSAKITTDLCDEYGFAADEREAKQYAKPLLVAFGQGFASMSSPTKEFARMVEEKKIAHDGNPALRWQMGNVVIDTDAAGNQKPDKAKSKEKIDAAVATLMAYDLAVRNPEGDKSIYEDRGLLVL